MNISISKDKFKKAKRLMPGGVNSPVRSFSSVNMNPVFMEKGKGGYLYDIDGNKYIDFVNSWGALILGHSHPDVMEALKKGIEKGTSFGTPTEMENRLAEKIIDAVPSIDKVRMVNSGTEATMTALRLARGYTKRKKIVKFQGNYHGHSDSLLIDAGSGALTHGVPSSPGVTEGVIEDTLTATFNDNESIENIFKEYGEEIAAVIIEPVAGNMGVVPMEEGFAKKLREITSQNDSLLIFDEIITGFRVAYSGAQSLYNIEPDLTSLGKIIGGGLPVGAFGGKKEIMDYMSPEGPVYQAGTLSGNPLSMIAGYTTLSLLHNKEVYKNLEEKGEKLQKGIEEKIKKLEVPVEVNRVGSMLTLFFSENKVNNFEIASNARTDLYSIYFKEMLSQGIYIAPSQFEGMFISLAHNDNHLETTINAIYKSLEKVKEKLKK